MFFSIVTVCLNAQNTIRATIESVIAQECKDWEYLIIDGLSTDKTLDIIQEYRREYAIRIVSEPDKGIYNAMNKAMNYVQGSYVYFLNSGDTFWDKFVLGKVKEKLLSTKASLLYGNISCVGEKKEKVVHYAEQNRMSIIYIAFGFTICHQAVFSKSELLKERGFNENFYLWADQEWLSYQLSNKVKVTRLKEIIARYPMNGISSDIGKLNVIREESDRISKMYAPVLFHIIHPIKEFVRNFRK